MFKVEETVFLLAGQQSAGDQTAFGTPFLPRLDKRGDQTYRRLTLVPPEH